MNEAQFLTWSEIGEGRTALDTGVLGPRTEETQAIGCHIPYPNQVSPEGPEVTDAVDNICLEDPKKCKHKRWRDVHNIDFVYSLKSLSKELAKLTKREEEIIDDAETREATKDYYADNTVTQLF